MNSTYLISTAQLNNSRNIMIIINQLIDNQIKIKTKKTYKNHNFIPILKTL